jgi:lipopolysaccharide/colanic/teichoic acid biosynthesis glycosyltransferase
MSTKELMNNPNYKGITSGIRNTREKDFVRVDGYNELSKALIDECGYEVYQYVKSHFNIDYRGILLFAKKKHFLYDYIDFNNVRIIINVNQLNNIQNIDSYFRSINKLLPDSGLYIGCVQTNIFKHTQLIEKYGKFFGNLAYFKEFAFHRIFAKMEYCRKFYRILTQNKYHALSLAESLGRFSYGGFEIIDYKNINGLTYFVGMKTAEPRTEKASSGLFFGMRRIGKNGNMIKVHKLRTMHPYSEFLQAYVVRLNGFNEIGKPKDDFRLAGWGKVLRKLWIDELPQLVNIFRGELGIFGVRPLSQTMYYTMPEDVQKDRIKYKPGIIPPSAALGKKGVQGCIEAERTYFRSIESKGSLRTNTVFFIQAISNILTGKTVSA